MDKIIKTFTCIPKKLVYNTENFKIYGTEIDVNKYPDIKLNEFNNVTIIGNIHELGIGIPYYIKAEEQISKYGHQYKVVSIKRDKPTNLHMTQMFLSELLTPEQVDTIITNYPDFVDRIINNQSDTIDLNKLYNIKTYRFNLIKQKIEENFVFAELIEMFKGLLNMKTIRKLYNNYPSALKIKQEIQNEPYKCLCSLSGISFKTADGIILELDEESKNIKQNSNNYTIKFNSDIKTSIQRAIATVDYLLEQNESNGHTRIMIVDLKNLFDKLVPECSDKFVKVIKDTNKYHIDKESKSVSLLETYNTEFYIAERIIEGMMFENKWDDVDLEQFRSIDDDKNKYKLTDEQFNAVKMFYENNISILNGSGGVGKSFTTQTILSLIKSSNKSFALFAPTGRASRILAKYTKTEASTIHRGLIFNPFTDPQWYYNEENKLPYDVIACDEFSMSDIFLTKHLLEAIDFSRTKLLIIGDDFQIASVGAGNVLFDLINSNTIPITSLTKVFRFGIGGISTISTKTRYGEKWIEDNINKNIFGEDKGYIYMPMSQEQIIPTVRNLYSKLINSGVLPEDILILSAYNIGEYGTEKINQIIQKIANKNYGSDLKFKCGDTTYYLDDIVIQTKNNYKAIIFNAENYNYYDEESAEKTFISNGDIGKVILIENEYMVVEFDDNKILYTRESGLNLKLSYAISLTKSQGGSAKNIILITPKAHTYMLNANLMYVGQSRSEYRCYHLGEPKTINLAIKKKENLNRKTHLKELLIKLNNLRLQK